MCDRGTFSTSDVANKMITIIWHMLTNDTAYTGVKKSLYNSKMREVMNTQ